MNGPRRREEVELVVVRSIGDDGLSFAVVSRVRDGHVLPPPPGRVPAPRADQYRYYHSGPEDRQEEGPPQISAVLVRGPDRARDVAEGGRLLPREGRSF